MIDQEKLLLTYREAAELLGISMRSLTRAVKLGELVPVQAPGTHGRSGQRFITQEITAHVEQLGQRAKQINRSMAGRSPSLPLRRIGNAVSTVVGRTIGIRGSKGG